MNQVDMILSPESSQIASFGYDSESQTLVIRFVTTGTTYHYFDVPPEIFDGLKAADSKGRFFGRNIRGVFRYQKQTD